MANDVCPCCGLELTPDVIVRDTRRLREQSLLASFCPRCGNLLRLEPAPRDPSPGGRSV